MYNMDNETGEGMFPLLIKDLKGGLIFSAKETWVDNMPTDEFGKTSSDMEITLETGEAEWEQPE
jgi:hypothetical protein